MKIRTDGKWHNFKYRYEVPARVLKSEFDWLDEEDGSDGFIYYKGSWYHLSMFERGGPAGWDGHHGDSYFSGVLIKVSRDGEQYKIATYME